MASSVSKESFPVLPNELFECIFRYLTVEDLCRVASCCRALRESANSDVLWRCLCREKGWERYGTVTDICKEIPFASTLHQNYKDLGRNSVSFHDDLLVNGSAWPGLVDTCKWKEIYMKARKLEANWRKNYYHIVSFKFGYESYNWQTDEFLNVCSLDSEGIFLAGSIRSISRVRNVRSINNDVVKIWDVTNGHCGHIIEVDISYGRHALKMKNGVLAVGCRDGKIRTYSVQTGEQLYVLSGHQLAVTRLFFDGETIVSVAQCRSPQFEDNEVRVWNSANGTTRFVFQSVSNRTQPVDLDYLDKTVAVAYNDNTIRLWDVWTGTHKGTITTGTNKVISCHLGDSFVISVSEDNDIKMWNLNSRECMKTFDVPDIEYEDSDHDSDSDDPYRDISSSLFNGELLVVNQNYSKLMIFNLDGKFLGYTESDGLEPICIHGNKLVTAKIMGGANHLWLVDRRDGFTLVEDLRPPMYHLPLQAELTSTVVSLNNTKLALVKYYDAEYCDEDEMPEEILKISVHHYW